MADVTTGWARRRARAGAALLDREDPGWAERIELRRLDIASLHRCIIGQLSDPDDAVDHAYDDYVERLGLDGHGQVEHGFLLPDDSADRAAYELLTLAWHAEVAERLASAGAP